MCLLWHKCSWLAHTSLKESSSQQHEIFITVSKWIVFFLSLVLQFVVFEFYIFKLVSRTLETLVKDFEVLVAFGNASEATASSVQHFNEFLVVTEGTGKMSRSSNPPAKLSTCTVSTRITQMMPRVLCVAMLARIKCITNVLQMLQCWNIFYIVHHLIRFLSCLSLRSLDFHHLHRLFHLH